MSERGNCWGGSPKQPALIPDIDRPRYFKQTDKAVRVAGYAQGVREKVEITERVSPWSSREAGNNFV